MLQPTTTTQHTSKNPNHPLDMPARPAYILYIYIYIVVYVVVFSYFSCWCIFLACAKPNVQQPCWEEQPCLHFSRRGFLCFPTCPRAKQAQHTRRIRWKPPALKVSGSVQKDSAKLLLITYAASAALVLCKIAGL